MIDILDVGIGNIGSIVNWLSKSAIPSRVIRRPDEIRSEILLLPGVGCAALAMHRLNSSGLSESIALHHKEGKKIIGICLGFQLLFSRSEENGGVRTLGFLEGHVVRLPQNGTHNGWENLTIDLRDKNILKNWRKIKKSRKRHTFGRYFFNHEFGVTGVQNIPFKINFSYREQEFCALCVTDQILGLQFHPEKSQIHGTKLLDFVL